MENWEKLKRVLLWVKENIDDKKIILTESLADVYTWIDTAYAVHGDTRSPTEGAISIGHRVLHKDCLCKG